MHTHAVLTPSLRQYCIHPGRAYHIQSTVQASMSIWEEISNRHDGQKQAMMRAKSQIEHGHMTTSAL